MDVEQLALPKDALEKEYLSLRDALRKNRQLAKQAVNQDYLAALKMLRHGKTVIDLYAAVKKAGLSAEGDPKLAIVVATAKTCFCGKRLNGSLLFSDAPVDRWTRVSKTSKAILLPAGMFVFPRKNPAEPPSVWNIQRETLQTPAPLIPPRILIDEVRRGLGAYYLLWEVERWEPTPPKDPMLLKRLSPNLFGVLATWDLSPLERAILRGRLEGA